MEEDGSLKRNYYRNPLSNFLDWDQCKLQDTPQNRKRFPEKFQRNDQLVDFEELHFPEDRPLFYYSEAERGRRWEKGREKWREIWLREWWDKADPEGLSPSNPFSNRYGNEPFFG